MKKPIRCTTHFHACDCREYEFEMMKKENEDLKEANKVLREAVEFYGDPEIWMIKDKHSWRKSSPKSHGDDEMIVNYHHPRRDWVGTITVGGKLAREALAKADEIMGEKR